ncbi:MAG: DNA-3-methyladenine glycosylase [Candidatus Nanopelagicales bacterium]
MTTPGERPRGLLGADPVSVAPRLLGSLLSSELGGATVTVRISEVEAYRGVGQDPGSHAHRRRTERNASMFAEPGTAYVYFTYGMHWCLNVVAHEPGLAGAVLLRAGEVVAGEASATQRRPAARSHRDLARGPARLCAALGVTRECDGWDLLAAGLLRLELAPAAPRAYLSTTRTGVGGAGAGQPWRFALPGDPTVSPHRPADVR